jgi:pilus assembly protein Flp/PilA
VFLQRGTRDGPFLGEVSMTRIAKRVSRFLRSDCGPTAVEYAVMLALIIVVCLVAIGTLGTNTQTTFTNIANSLGS